MFIPNQQTFQRFDKFKDQFKKDKTANNKNTKKSFQSSSFKITNFPFKKPLIYLALFGTLFYGASHLNSQSGINYLIKNGYLNYFTFLSYKTLWKDVKNYFFHYGQTRNYKNQYNSQYANRFFVRAIRQDLYKMKVETNEKKISETTRSEIGIGFIRIQSKEDTLKINRNGDVINEHKNSLFKIGSIHFFGRKKIDFLEKNNIYGFYDPIFKEQENKVGNKEQFDSHCRKINILKRLSLQQKETQKLIQQCKQKCSSIFENIQKIYKSRDKQRMAQQRLKFFIIS